MTDPKDRIEEILSVFSGPNMDFKEATSQILELIKETLQEYEVWGGGDGLPDPQTGKTNVDYFFEEELEGKE